MNLGKKLVVFFAVAGLSAVSVDSSAQLTKVTASYVSDSAGVLPNGKSFSTPAGLKTILRADKDEFAKCLTGKLLTYALGRGLERFDRPAVQSISRRTAAEGYRFSSLVMNIVESMPFQMRRGEGPKS